MKLVIFEFLILAKVIQFHHLLALLGPGLDEKTILKGLHDFAILVQGCWVIKRLEFTFY